MSDTADASRDAFFKEINRLAAKAAEYPELQKKVDAWVRDTKREKGRQFDELWKKCAEARRAAHILPCRLKKFKRDYPGYFRKEKPQQKSNSEKTESKPTK